MRTAPAGPVAAVGLGVLILTGCTSSSPSESGPALPAETDFAEGTCRLAAPDVIVVGSVLPRLGEGGAIPADVQSVLRDALDRLDVVAETAEPAVKPVLDDFVIKIGSVLILAVGSNFGAVQGEQLATSYRSVVATCRAQP